MPRQNNKSTDGKPVRRKQSPPDRYQPPPPPTYSPTPLSTSRRQGPPPPLILTRHSPYQRVSTQHDASRTRVPSLSPTESTRPNTATSSVFSPQTPYTFPCAAVVVSHPAMAIRGWHPHEEAHPEQHNTFFGKTSQHRAIADVSTPSHHSVNLARSSSLPILPPILPLNGSMSRSQSTLPPLSPSARFLQSNLTTLPKQPIHSSPASYQTHSSPFRPWIDSPPCAPHLSFTHRLDSPMPVPPYSRPPPIEAEMSGFVPLKPSLNVLLDHGPWLDEGVYEYGVRGQGSTGHQMDIDDLRGVEHLMGLGLRVN